MRTLPRRFYARDAVVVAEALLGMHLLIRRPEAVAVARIVETEAYQGPDDLAAHSVGGRRTARTEVMFGRAGHAYVYLIYGMWNCLNIVTATAGIPHAVLLRAVEPVSGFDAPSWGPGLLCRALGIDRSHNGIDLCKPGSSAPGLWLAAPPRLRESASITPGTGHGVPGASTIVTRPMSRPYQQRHDAAR